LRAFDKVFSDNLFFVLNIEKRDFYIILYHREYVYEMNETRACLLAVPSQGQTMAEAIFPQNRLQGKVAADFCPKRRDERALFLIFVQLQYFLLFTHGPCPRWRPC